MDSMKAWLWLFGFLAFGIMLLWFRIKKAMNSLKYDSKDLVCARVKTQENGRWLCKFFLCGDHMGYLASEPSSDRVTAVVIGFDDELQLYKLKEVHETAF